MSSKNKPTNILFLHTGAELYGADQILFSLVTNLDKSKFNPIVVLPNDGPLVNKLRTAKIKTEIISYPIIRRKFFNTKGIFNFIKFYFRSSKQLCDLCKKEHISVIHNNTIAVLEGIYIKKSLGLKLITHVHEMIEKPKFVARFLYKAHLKNCDSMIAVSQAAKKHIEKIIKAPNKKIVVVNNGLNQPKEEHNNILKYYNEFSLPKTAKIIGFVGRINAIKGYEDFIKSLRYVIDNHENVYGLMIGDAYSGQEWRINDLRNRIKENHLEKNIIYCGFRNDVNDIYQIFDLLVLSSVQYDSFPTVVLEAMSRGIPTVAYRCGGVEEMVINEYNGFLVEQGNTNELSAKIESLLTDDSTLRNMRRNCKTFFEMNFTIDKFINAVCSSYKDNQNE